MSESTLVLIIVGLIFITVLTFLVCCRVNSPTVIYSHVIEGMTVDIPVMDGEKFTNNIELARRIEKNHR